MPRAIGLVAALLLAPLLLATPSTAMAMAAAPAAKGEQKATATREFRALVRQDAGLKRHHRGQLVRAVGKSLAWGTVGGLIMGEITGTFAYPTQGRHGMLVVGGVTALVGGTAYGAGVYRENLQLARTNTVALAVADKKLAPTVASRWQAAGLITKAWKR